MALNVGEIRVGIIAELRKFKKQLRESEGLIKTFGRRMKQNMQTLGARACGVLKNAVGKLFHALTRLAKIALVAFVAMIGKAIHSAAKFEHQLAFVSTMLGEGTMKYMRQYEKGLNRLAVEYGEATETLSRGLYDILSASIDASKAMGVLEVSVRAAKAGLTSTAVSADAITSILNSYGLSADKAQWASDVLFATVKRGKTTFDQLAPSIGGIMKTAALLGVEFEEVGAALATMTRGGVRTDEATTALNMSMMSMIKTTDEAQEKFEKLFKTTERMSQYVKRVGFQEFIRQLAQMKLEAHEITELFPRIRSTKAMAALLSDIRGFNYDLGITYNSVGMTDEAFTKMTETLSFQLGRLREAFSLLLRTVGKELLPQIKELTQFILDAMPDMVEYAREFGKALSSGLEKLREIFAIGKKEKIQKLKIEIEEAKGKLPLVEELIRATREGAIRRKEVSPEAWRELRSIRRQGFEVSQLKQLYKGLVAGTTEREQKIKELTETTEKEEQKITTTTKKEAKKRIEIAEKEAERKSALWLGLKTGIEEYYKSISDWTKNIKEGIISLMQSIENSMATAFKDMITGAKNFGDAMKGLFRAIGDAILDMIVKIIAKLLMVLMLKALIKATGVGGGLLGLITGHKGGKVTTKGIIPSFQYGGEVPALLQPGEFVVNRQQAQANLPLLEAINRGEGAALGDTYNITIHAVDSESFVSMLRKNPESIIRITQEGIMRESGLRRTIMEYARTR